MKKLFWPCCQIKVGDGARTRFWEDIWLKDKTLANIFPDLYLISQNQQITVLKVSQIGINNLSFRRRLLGSKGASWIELKNLWGEVILSVDDDDKLIWTLTPSVVFSVKSFYKAMQSCGKVPYNFLWRVKIPLRVKTFMWMVLKKKHSDA